MRVLILFLLSVALANGWSINHESKADEHMSKDWWDYGVFYQIYPRSFKDSDGDGRGDLKGITEKLDHLDDLGVTGVWLSPIFKSPFVDGGYDIQDFKTVDPMFGTNADLKALFVKAKQLNIKIILDFVPNHTSDLHEWFVLSANRTVGFEAYYVWVDCPLVNAECVRVDCERVLPNNWISVFANPAWTYHSGRGQCYLHQFTPEQPDLNYRNPVVYQEMIDILKYWLVEGADGFRIDAINHMFETVGFPNETYIDPEGDKTAYDNLDHIHTMNRPESYQFIYDVRKMMDEYVESTTDKHPRMMMTEAYASIPQQVRWYGHNATTKGSHMPFNFALISQLNEASKAADFDAAVGSWMKAMPAWGAANWVMGNHDRSRVGSRYGADRHESLAIMTMMLPGINVIYNGEEILMTDNCAITWEETDDPAALQTNETVYLQYSRDPVRTPFQWDNTTSAGFSNTTGKTWLPMNANFLTVNLAAQKAAEKSTFKLYQRLIKTRKDNHVLHMGDFKSKTLGDEVFAFTRTLKDHDSLAVFVNLGGAKNVSLKALLEEKDFNEAKRAKILIINNNSKLSVGGFVGNMEQIELGQYDAVVLEVSSAGKLAVSMLLIAFSLIKFIF